MIYGIKAKDETLVLSPSIFPLIRRKIEEPGRWKFIPGKETRALWPAGLHLVSKRKG